MVRFSVIVPLEFHRDQIDLCLRRWVRGQDYSRDDYEVLAAVGAGALSPAHRTAIEAQLDRRDRLLVYPDRHDVGLCARAAFEARGELLFFTESHVLPEPDTLTRADQAMRARPDADGLSGRCDPIVHNRLSVAEAAMYQRDIRHGMEQHPWRRILDQCYVARREPYFRAGGFAAVYGHFAEWLLAARMHAAGMVVAYAPEVVLHHVYCGRVRELVAFARDFATGQVRYEAEATDEPCRALLDAVPEWDTSVGLGAARARAALRRSASLFSRSGAWNLAWWRWLVVALGRWWVRPWIRCGVAAVASRVTSLAVFFSRVCLAPSAFVWPPGSGTIWSFSSSMRPWPASVRLYASRSCWRCSVSRWPPFSTDAISPETWPRSCWNWSAIRGAFWAYCSWSRSGSSSWNARICASARIFAIACS